MFCVCYCSDEQLFIELTINNYITRRLDIFIFSFLNILKNSHLYTFFFRHITQLPPPVSLHQRLTPSVYGQQHLQSKSNSENSSESNRSPNSDNESRNSPQNRLPINGVSTHNSESNNVHISINRRIGLPPSFFFPENQTPPSDLNGDISASKRRPFTQDETQLLNLEIPNSESETHLLKSSNSSSSTTDKTSKCFHSVLPVLIFSAI